MKKRYRGRKNLNKNNKTIFRKNFKIYVTYNKKFENAPEGQKHTRL